MQGIPTPTPESIGLITGATGLDLLATATQAEALAVIGVAGQDNVLAAYSFTPWNPINLSFGASAAPSTGTQIDNDYVTFSNSGGILTITIDVAGTYLFSILMTSNHGAGMSAARVRTALGGTATLATSTALDYANNAVPGWDMLTSYPFSGFGTVGQTVTVRPFYEVTGSGSTTQHTARCAVNVLYCGS